MKTKVSKVKPWECKVCGLIGINVKSKRKHLEEDLEEIEDLLGMYEALERIVYSEIAKLTPLKKK